MEAAPADCNLSCIDALIQSIFAHLSECCDVGRIAAKVANVRFDPQKRFPLIPKAANERRFSQKWWQKAARTHNCRDTRLYQLRRSRECRA